MKINYERKHNRIDTVVQRNRNDLHIMDVKWFKVLHHFV
jgi:hypothetical protein